MDELRVVRREDGSLILANELGEEYRLAIDEALVQEARLALPRATSSVPVRPREIQALLRAGKTRAEVAAETGLEEGDVERFEEPVRAEKRYMLDLAHAVVVRTDPAQSGGSPSANADDDQRFGQVIAERLVALGNTTSEWRSWRDEETGWLIGLTFDSRDDMHDAIWSFDHKKRVLSPLTLDATNLSKLGEIGDRLIPKLRAVDNAQQERQEQAPFDPDGLLAPTEEVEPLPRDAAPPADEANAEPENPDAEYERRREIDHLAIKTTGDEAQDLSQTADLLDALRRRRGERSREAEATTTAAESDDSELPSGGAAIDALGLTPAAPEQRRGAGANIWGTAGVSGEAASSTDRDADTAQLRAVPRAAPDTAPSAEPTRAGEPAAERNEPAPADVTDGRGEAKPEKDAKSEKRDARAAKRGRSSIPSWDDILFGTRSDDDPA